MEADWRPKDRVGKWVWTPKYFNHRHAILLTVWLPQPMGETMQPWGRSGQSLQCCQCYSAWFRAVGSPGLFCVSWRVDRWSWILGRVMGFLIKVFFIVRLPPIFWNVLSYRFHPSVSSLCYSSQIALFFSDLLLPLLVLPVCFSQFSATFSVSVHGLSHKLE